MDETKTGLYLIKAKDLYAQAIQHPNPDPGIWQAASIAAQIAQAEALKEISEALATLVGIVDDLSTRIPRK
jgi:hypothetical protein